MNDFRLYETCYKIKRCKMFLLICIMEVNSCLLLNILYMLNKSFQ